MPREQAIPLHSVERAADSGISVAKNLGKVPDRSLLVMFMLFSMAVNVAGVWWAATTGISTLNANTAALSRCASIMERLEAHFSRP